MRRQLLARPLRMRVTGLSCGFGNVTRSVKRECCVMGTMHEDETAVGDYVAPLLLAGDANEYARVQGLMLDALQTGNWVYGNQIMSIIWALLPEEARKLIAQG